MVLRYFILLLCLSLSFLLTSPFSNHFPRFTFHILWYTVYGDMWYSPERTSQDVKEFWFQSIHSNHPGGWPVVIGCLFVRKPWSLRFRGKHKTVMCFEVPPLGTHLICPFATPHVSRSTFPDCDLSTTQPTAARDAYLADHTFLISYFIFHREGYIQIFT